MKRESTEARRGAVWGWDGEVGIFFINLADNQSLFLFFSFSFIFIFLTERENKKEKENCIK